MQVYSNHGTSANDFYIKISNCQDVSKSNALKWEYLTLYSYKICRIMYKKKYCVNFKHISRAIFWWIDLLIEFNINQIC